MQRHLAPGSSESSASSQGLEAIEREIRFLEGQIEALGVDYRTVRGVVSEEVDAMKRELRNMGPLAAYQVAVAQHSLCEDLAKKWESLAQKLGAE